MQHFLAARNCIQWGAIVDLSDNLRRDGGNASAATSAPNAQADDSGKSVYLLGKRGPLAASVPKAGCWLSNVVYSCDE
jgi:hypothetical protein